MSKKNNKNKQVDIEQAALEFVVKLVENCNGKQSDKYHLMRLLDIKPVKAAKLLGYNESYAYDLDQKFRDDTKVRERVLKICEKMPGAYQAMTKLRLAKISEIEGKALAEYEKNPMLAVSKPQLLKHLKISAGVLDDDLRPQAPQVNIKELQVLIQNTITEKDQGIIDITHNNED